METEWRLPQDLDLPGYKPNMDGHPRRVKEAVKMLAASRRPVLYVGGGIIKSEASEALARFAELSNIPVVTTLMGRGAIPDDHPLCLGMPGMHGNYTAITSMQKCDVLAAIGVRFDDRVTGDPKHFAVDAKVIHADIDPAEIGKVRTADIPIVADARRVLEQMIKAWGDRPPLANQDWMNTLRGWQEKHPLSYQQHPDGPIKPQFVIEELARVTGGDAILVGGVGQHQMWASQFWKFDRPRRWINSGGLGTMGFAVPAAIGAKAGMPDELVYAVDGDGCFQMTFQELIAAAAHRIPVKVAVFNNGRPRHGKAVAETLLWGPTLRKFAERRDSGLREAGGRDGAASGYGRKAPRRGGTHHREVIVHRRPSGGGGHGDRPPTRWSSPWFPPEAPTTG